MSDDWRDACGRSRAVMGKAQFRLSALCPPLDRFNGEVYICGCGGSDYVSGSRLREGGDCEHQGLVHADPKRVQAASSSFAGLTTMARDRTTGAPLQPDVSQVNLCFVQFLLRSVLLVRVSIPQSA